MVDHSYNHVPAQVSGEDDEVRDGGREGGGEEVSEVGGEEVREGGRG